MDAETFKKVFLSHAPKLYRIAYRMTEDEIVAEDIVQETFIKLWNNRNDMSGIDNHEAFCITILKNTCLDYLRKSKHTVPIDLKNDNTETQSLQDEIESKDRLNHVKSLILQLPEQQRQVMIMKHWNGYTDKEIEQITGISAGNIRVLISRARKTLREQFQKTELK